MRNNEGSGLDRPGEKRAVVDRWDEYYGRGQAVGGYPVSPIVERLFIDSIADDCTVLEIGCGTGRSYSHLMDLLISWDRPRPLYVGADASLNALQMSGKRSGFNPVLCDMFHLPFNSQCFQIVYSRNAFSDYSLASMREAGGEICRVLAPGGFVAVEERGVQDRSTGESQQSFTERPIAPLTRERAVEVFDQLEVLTWSEDLRKRKTSTGGVTVHTITAVLGKR